MHYSEPYFSERQLQLSALLNFLHCTDLMRQRLLKGKEQYFGYCYKCSIRFNGSDWRTPVDNNACRSPGLIYCNFAPFSNVGTYKHCDPI